MAHSVDLALLVRFVTSYRSAALLRHPGLQQTQRCSAATHDAVWSQESMEEYCNSHGGHGDLRTACREVEVRGSREVAERQGGGGSDT